MQQENYNNYHNNYQQVNYQRGEVNTGFLVKANSANTVISGYASVFDIADAHGDIIIKGAFSNSYAYKVRLLWQHDPLKPIGIVKTLTEDIHGLRINAEINNRIANGIEASELIKQKAIDGLSIGFVIKSADYNNQGQRLIKELELMEISIVTFPANYAASIRQVKNKSVQSRQGQENSLARQYHYSNYQCSEYHYSLNKLAYLSGRLIND